MSLPEGEVVFLMTDIVGSSALAERDHEHYLASILQHDEQVAKAVASHGGHLLKHRGEGDSTFSVFASSDAAVQAALEIHEKLGELNTLIRTGIHFGPAQRIGQDYLGDTVNRCARLRGMAKPNQILVSNAVREACTSSFHFTSFGLQPMRGMTRGVEVFEVSNPAALTAIVAHSAPLNPPPKVFNRFLRRDAELKTIVELITEYRLVTIHGEGGIGKTRLAIEVTGHCKSTFNGGIEFIGMNSTSAANCLSELNRILDRPSSLKKLVILDGCEQMMERIGAWIEDALLAAPNLTFLVTSQIALQTESEYLIRLLPLGTKGVNSDSLELLFARAQEKGATKAQLLAQKRECQELVVRLDGVPLAIEIVASRLRSVSARKILDSLHNFGSEASKTNSGDRWASFNELCRYTIGLLSPSLLRFARGCSVLGKSFSFEAAATLPPELAMNEVETAENLESLVTHSILTPAWDREGLQYRMSSAFRAELSSGLEESVRLEISNRLRRWALDTCAAVAESPAAAIHIRPVLPDVVAVIEQAISDGDSQTASKLLQVARKSWIADEQPYPGISLIEQVIQLLADGTDERADALNSLGILLNFANRRAESIRIYERAIEEYSLLGNVARVAVVRHNRALLQYQEGEFSAAIMELNHVLETALSLPNDALQASCLVHLAAAHFELGQPEQAEQLATQAEQLGSAFTPAHFSIIELERGEYAFSMGNIELAETCFRAVIDHDVFVQNNATIARLALNLSLILHAKGRLEQGRRLARAGVHFAITVGVHFSPRDRVLAEIVRSTFPNLEESPSDTVDYTEIREEICEFSLAFSAQPN